MGIFSFLTKDYTIYKVDREGVFLDQFADYKDRFTVRYSTMHIHINESGKYNEVSGREFVKSSNDLQECIEIVDEFNNSQQQYLDSILEEKLDISGQLDPRCDYYFPIKADPYYRGGII